MYAIYIIHLDAYISLDICMYTFIHVYCTHIGFGSVRHLHLGKGFLPPWGAADAAQSSDVDRHRMQSTCHRKLVSRQP